MATLIGQRNIMILQITKPKYEYLPEGSYTAFFRGLSEPKQKINLGCDEQIQLNFDVCFQGRKFRPYRKFCMDLEEGGDLYLFLKSWLQDRFERYVNDDGGFDFDLLKGMGADITIDHFQKAGYTTPFINIITITPPGVFVLCGMMKQTTYKASWAQRGALW